MTDLPPLALSVRQPWAWAIVAGHKVIENRSAGAIRAGRMDCRRIAIHAATGLKRDEYDWAVWRLDRHGVAYPRPDALVRGAIIGAVDVVDIVDRSDSEWFGGPMGLVLANASVCDPIPAIGELGYFRWARAGALAQPMPWMTAWGRRDSDGATGDLFSDLPTAYREAPRKPWSAPDRSGRTEAQNTKAGD